MFRRIFISASRLSVAAASIQIGATTITAPTDKELNKKPLWYRESVQTLEDTLKKLSTYKLIENQHTLDHAEDILIRVIDYNSCELSWRLGRVLVEKAALTKDTHEKEKFLSEAIDHCRKALAIEPANGSAGAHKWYALALCHLYRVNKKHNKVVNANEQITEHFMRSVQIDSKDPFTWHFLGVNHYHNKNYKEAIKCLKEAEKIKENFSAANLFYLGDSYRLENNKEEAIRLLKKTLTLPVKNTMDGRAKVDAKQTLITSLKLDIEMILPPKDEF
jgi:tetratricopeptide (TPR) repeat protein